MRYAEEIVDYFNSEELSKTVLNGTVLPEICHINQYNPTSKNTVTKINSILQIAHDYYLYDLVLPKACMETNYTNPSLGSLPDRHVSQTEVNQVAVPLYAIANAIDWLEKYDDNKKILERAFQVLEASHIKKVMDDMFHLLMSCGADRNFLVFDSRNNKFSSHLVDLMIQTGEDNKSPITHLIISPEAHEAVGFVKEINDIKLLPLDELGVGQEYQLFFENQLECMIEERCTELIIGVAYGQDGAMILQPNTHPLKLELQDKFTNDLDITRYGAFLTTNATGFVCEEAKVILGSF